MGYLLAYGLRYLSDAIISNIKQLRMCNYRNFVEKVLQKLSKNSPNNSKMPN